MEAPSSPGTTLVDLRVGIEDLLRFTLKSRLNGTLEIELEDLSADFCSDLLNDDPNSTEKLPLYKVLASALYESITYGNLSGTHDKWLHETGLELANMLKRVNFEIHVQEPYFTQLKAGLKTVEGRCAVGDYMRIGPGALLLVNKCLVLGVQDVHHYASFSELLKAEGLPKVLPGIKTIEEGVLVYRKFYTEEKERSNGVVAILVTKPELQPYIGLARILSRLKETGIRSLINDHIAGSGSSL